MSISVPEKIWWKPIDKEEKIWVAIALILSQRVVWVRTGAVLQGLSGLDIAPVPAIRTGPLF